MTTARDRAAQGAPATAHGGRGALVTLEGVDGSGKSSLAAELAKTLEARGLAVMLTREPTSSWLGQAVKRAIREGTDPFVEAFLFLADHADHVRQVSQWVAQGKVVVSDRYGDSCLAYQAATLEPLLQSRGLHALDWLASTQAPINLTPDLCLLIDLEPRVALARIAGREELIKFEEAELLAKVRSNYLRLSRRFPYYEVLDGTMAPDKLLASAMDALQRRRVVPS
jgi:dTMP kinase